MSIKEKSPGNEGDNIFFCFFFVRHLFEGRGELLRMELLRIRLQALLFEVFGYSRIRKQKMVHSKHELKLKFIYLLDIFLRVGEASYFENDYRLLRF